MFCYTIEALNCVCKPGHPCAYHAVLSRLSDSGVGLHQRLAIVNYSTIPAQQHEAAIIRAELRRRARED